MVSRLRALRLAAVLGATLSASAAFSQPALPPNETGTIGRRIADARLVDANGDELRVRSLAGKPLIVSPIFTRCRHVCPRITANLKSAIAGLGAPGEDFNVLSVTFDAGDTQEDLERFRERMELPDAWKLVRGDPEQVRPLLDSIDFRFIEQKDGQFLHPNLVVFLTRELTIAKYLYGVDYSAADVRKALNIALGRVSLLDRLAPYLFLIGVLGVIGSLFVILVTLTRSRAAKPGTG